MRQKFVFLIFGAYLLVPAAALAQQTGSVSGVILDQTGSVIPGATVRISGDQLPAGRTVKSDANGIYRFPVLLPGQYTVQVEQTGFGKAVRAVVVDIDRDTQLDLTIGVTTSEALTVTAATPVVNVKSTEVNFNYKAAEIEALPLQKNYSGLFQLIPGVADNNSFAPSGGGSRQDNKYLIDGVDITNPGFGYLSTEVNGLDIAEFNIKRGAITAEFGRASGFVTNAVSRSGTNVFHGIANLELRPRSFGAAENTLNTAGEVVKIDNTIDRTFGSGSLGGPLLKDRLFFYGSALWSRVKTTGRTNQLGAVPDRTVRTDELFGKVTGQPTPTMLINGGFRYRPSDCEFCGIGNTQAASVAMNTESDTKVATITWNWFLLNRTILEARYIHMEENATNLPLTDLGFQPTWNPNDLASMGQFSDTTGPSPVTRGVWNFRSEQVDYKRDEFRASFNQFFDLGTTAHELKAGFGFEEGSETLDRKSNGWGLISIVGTGGSQIQANYYPEQPAQESPGRTYSLFVQDNISIGSRLVVNAGLLLNRDEFSQVLAQKNTFLTFGFGDEIQPRLGLNYQLRKGQGDKAYANWGRYYAMDQKSSARSLAPSRLFTNDALFNRATGVLISDIPRASTTNKTIDAGLKPTYTDEWLVGYGTPLMRTWGLDIFFINRETFDFIEDIPTSLPATGPFHAAQLTGAERKYRSLTIELSRRLANNWALSTSYSWSRLEGNFDLDYASGAVFNTSSAIQDGPGEFVQDRYRNGPLSQDRPHVFKVFGSYAPPRLPNLTLGGYLRAQSGATWAARGIDWDNGLRRYLEQAGSRRNEAWTNLDLLAAYRVPVSGRTRISIEGRVLNLFGNLTSLNVDQRQYLDPRIRPAGAAFAVCGTDYACATDLFSAAQTTNQPNARFGQGSEWAPPRRFILSFRADF
ncbi:MAG TPA: TonB-dependent receptor [Vicinamibacterales bacterium]|nr:TonB-dependent receptor [Vicinamibacterales bacterium]